MSGLALLATGLLVWSLVLNVVYGNVFYDSLFTFLGLLLLSSALCLRVLHMRRRRLEKKEGGVGERTGPRKRRRVVSMLACAEGCEEERKEGGKEGKVERGGFLMLDSRRLHPACGGKRKDGEAAGQRRGEDTQTGVVEAGKAVSLQRALLTPPSHHRHQHHDHHYHWHHHSWLLAVRTKEKHYLPVLGGETQVG
jgi:hypothetical protein